MAGWILQSRGESPITLRVPAGGIKTIGRTARADFIVDAALVSRIHCRLTASPSDQLVVEDLGSTNGTLVNGKRVLGEQLLSDGDRLQLGPVVLMVRLDRHGSIVDAHLCKQSLKDDSNEYSPSAATVERELTDDTPV